MGRTRYRALLQAVSVTDSELWSDVNFTYEAKTDVQRRRKGRILVKRLQPNSLHSVITSQQALGEWRQSREMI